MAPANLMALANASRPAEDGRMRFSVTDLLALLFVGFVVLVLAMRAARRRAAARASSEPVGTDFTVDELDELHRAGQLSAKELERAKASLQARRGGTPS